MFRSIFFSMVMLALVGGCNRSTDQAIKEATITNVDAKKGSVTVKLKENGKEVDKTFKLAENIEYVDGWGDVATADIFTSGDLALIVERDGWISKISKKPKGNVTKKPASKDETAFTQTADQIDLAEVKLGKVAEEHASSEPVKKFGERAAHDHLLMNKELKEITTKKGIVLSEKLDQKHQELVDELSKLNGAKFDVAYTKDMVSGHEKTIEQFEQEAKNGQDPEIKAWANKWLPTLKEHLNLAKDAVKDVKGK